MLCGHSSGCAIALAAAASGLPVDGLVLWEAPLGSQGGGAQAWTDEVSRRTDAGDPEGALEHYMKDMPPEWLEGARRSPIFPTLVGQVGSLRADGEALAWTESAPHAELFAGIRVPVEVLMGEQTFTEMFAAGDSIADAIPGTVQNRIAGANHAWEPDAMAAELARFMKSVDAAD